MKTIHNNLNKQEVELYLIMYVRHSFNLTESEFRMTYAPDFKYSKFKALCKEFCSDNDYRCLTKIQSNIGASGYSESGFRKFISNLKNHLESLPDFGQLERMKFSMLNKLIITQ
jgi:hypothetical protein